MAFKMKSKATRKAAKSATERGGGLNRFTWGDGRVSAELLILGEVHDDVGAVFTSKNHEYWANKKPLSKCGTPSYTSAEGGKATGEKDKIVELGWKLRDKYENSKNKKKKEFWKNCMLRDAHSCIVLDLKNLDAGPLVYSMPMAVSNVVLEEFNDLEDDDTSSICDFDEGRKLYIKSNGEKGTKRKYKVVKFKDEVNLLADGILTDEDVEEMSKKVYNMSKLQIPYDEEEFDKHYEFLRKKAEAIGIDFDDLDTDDEETEDDEYAEDASDDDMSVDEEDLNLNMDEDEDGESETEIEEVEEAPKKPARRGTGRRRTKRK